MFLLSLPILIMPTASYCKQLWVWPGPFLLLNDDRQKRKYRIEGESNFQQKLPEETRANITASLLFTYYKHEAISSGFWGHLQHKAPTDQSNNFCNQQHIVCLPVIWFSQEECEKPYKKGRLNFFYWISCELTSTLKFYTLKIKSMTQPLLDFPILSLQSSWTPLPSVSSATAGGSP